MLGVIDSHKEFVELWAYTQYNQCGDYKKFGVSEERIKEIDNKIYNYGVLTYYDDEDLEDRELKTIYLFFDKVICLSRISRCFTKLNTIGIIVYLLFCCFYSASSALCISMSKSPDIINIINIIMFFILFLFYGFHSLSNFSNSYYGVGTVPKMAIYRQMFFAEFILTVISMSSTVFYLVKIFSGYCN